MSVPAQIPLFTTSDPGVANINFLTQQINSLISYVNSVVAGTAPLDLGSSVSLTDPQIAGDPTSGFYTPGAAQVAVAISGVQVALWNASGVTVTGVSTATSFNATGTGTTPQYKVGGTTALWLDNTNFNTVSGNSNAPATISQSGGGQNGTRNTAFGSAALNVLTTGIGNSAFGRFALNANTTGQNNTGIGRNASPLSILSSNNTAVGTNSMALSTSGDGNVVIGSGCASVMTTGGPNTIIGTAVGSTNLTTNSNIILIGTDGTTDVFSASTAAGAIGIGIGTKPGSLDTLLGYQASNATTADSNKSVAIGYQALKANTNALQNTAVGYQALTTSVTGNQNTAIGANALLAANGTTDNTAVGRSAGVSTTSGGNNTYVGSSAGKNGTTANNNVGVGLSALQGGAANSSASNTAVGNSSLSAVTTAASNSALGNSAGSSITSGNNNTVVGASVASVTLQSGTGNILLGVDSSTDTAAAGTSHTFKLKGTGTALFTATSLDGTPVLTINGTVTASNLAGTGSRAVLADVNGLLSAPVSDATMKENIEPLNYGVDTIKALFPISFLFKEEYKNYGVGRQIGFLAQDMAQHIPEITGVTTATDKMYIDYAQLTTVLVKAVQELSMRVETLEAKLALQS